jgi:hypothetical protein
MGTLMKSGNERFVAGEFRLKGPNEYTIARRRIVRLPDGVAYIRTGFLRDLILVENWELHQEESSINLTEVRKE